MTREIILSNSQISYIDEDDFELVNQFRWYPLVNPNVTYANSSHTKTLMHRLILGLNSEDKRLVDHKDRNGLNNQRSNLRIATRSQNGFNYPPTEGSYKGVSWDAAREKWKAQIMIDRKQINIGRFDDPIEAAKAYDRIAKERLGEFAYLNFSELEGIG